MLYKLIIIALALSIDALGIGLTYGIRGIKISPAAKLIITFQAIAITLLAMEFGALLKNLLPPHISSVLGTALLIILGIWIILQSRKEEKLVPDVTKKHSFFFKHLGITVEIIRTPQSCDIDNSETIDTFEAIYLGFALSIDGFAAVASTGIVSGFSSILPFLLALMQIILLSLGSSIGAYVKNSYPINPKLWTFCSGMLLIVIAVISAIY